MHEPLISSYGEDLWLRQDFFDRPKAVSSAACANWLVYGVADRSKGQLLNITISCSPLFLTIAEPLRSMNTHLLKSTALKRALCFVEIRGHYGRLLVRIGGLLAHFSPND